jgi:hypothetical protein
LEKQYEKILRASKQADKTIYALDSAIKQINNAQGWGLFDTFGGKFFATLIKRTRIKSAEEKIARANLEIENLNAQLTDIEKIVDIDFNMSPLLVLADYFFGETIADIVVLGQLGETKIKLKNAKMEVLKIKERLKDLRMEAY